MPSTEPGPTVLDLPALYSSADAASGRGQRQYLRLNAIRYLSLLVGALAAAIGSSVGFVDAVGWILLGAFMIAAFSEFALIWLQPERDWYAGRAIAESIKTLSWRFAVGGEPFGSTLKVTPAEELFLDRVKDLLKKGSDRIELSAEFGLVTSSMRALRSSSLDTRRSTYLAERTHEQRTWYSDNAKKNATRAGLFRYGLLAAEIIAVVAAALAIGRQMPLDFAGAAAAIVAAGAAWMSVKQYSQLTSAYRVAAVELGIQEAVLAKVGKKMWGQAVADAEEAISREHTMWLASRGAG